MNNRLLRAGILTTLFWFCVLPVPFPLTAEGAEVSGIPVPAWLDMVQVSQAMIINGLPSEVHYFKADKEVEQVLAFYRNRWAADAAGRKPGYRESDFGPWRVISRLEGSQMLTVQARTNGSFGAEGYLAAADTRKGGQRGSLPPVPSLKGSTVVNDLITRDGGREARTMLLLNGSSVASNSNYYRDHYRAGGWGTLMDLNRNGSQVMVFGRSGREAHLVISNAGGPTSIVMNLVEN